ncbi:LapA family protein [Pseudonocardia halophobica]|uniref:LapA family protein n=1 Tax=Pseudonocardia halophobica TaxID=29401 RepID=UPI003D90CEE0
MVEQTSPGDTTAADGHRSGRLSGGVIATLVGAGLLLVFMIQNTAPVSLRFLFWSWSWPLWLFTLVTALLGALVWFGLGVLRRHRRRVARRADR